MAPGFTLESAQGTPVALSDYLGKSDVVLVFYRGQTWGACRQQIVDLQSHYQDFQAHQVEILALAVHDVAGAQRVAQATGASFPLLADPDHAVADAYGVYNLLGDGLATPAVFIVDKSGHIAWSYVSQNASDRPAAQTILDNLPPP
jgi:peroxiredoxin